MQRLVFASLALFATSCSSFQSPAVLPAAVRTTIVAPAAKQNVYWALFAPQPKPQLEIAAVPLTKTSPLVTIKGSTQNLLQEASSVRFSQNLAWVLTQPNGPSAPSVLLIFSLPLTPSSTPLYYDTLGGDVVGVHLEFDGHGNLWASSAGNDSVYEYSGDFFQEGGNFEPSLTLTAGLKDPQGLAFDPNGNLYVANGGKNQIAVFKQPISNEQTYFLGGIINPGGLAFDANGNLYAASNNGSAGAMVRYGSQHLHAGAKPTVVDPTGIKANAYGSDIAFDRAGNLYDADCGDKAGIYTYPLATKQFTKTLAPAFYTNKGVSGVGCVWGLAIH